MKVSKQLVIIVLATILILVGLVLFATQKGNSPASQLSPTTTPPVSEPQPSSSDLEDCLAKASNSEAQASVIEAGRQACYDQYN